MELDLTALAHNTLCGGLAAMGFGVLFNMGGQSLPWCGVGGGLALALRTLGLQLGWSLEAASFVAALAVGSLVQIFQERMNVSRNTLDVASCIPMIPGSFAAKAILGLFALTAPKPEAPDQTLILSVTYGLRVMFSIGAMGTGLAIPSVLLRVARPRK
jgi:uncharacterized membrane protein YjjB (DUF3815 family)